jgi:hypothetical protein
MPSEYQLCLLILIYCNTIGIIGTQALFHDHQNQHDELHEGDAYNGVKLFPDVQIMPSPKNPFIFLHIEKSAGSTLRK